MEALFRYVVKLLVLAGLLPRPKREADTGQERFLIVQLAGTMGDTIMLLPMIEKLRAEHPLAHIACAVEAGSATLLRRMSLLDYVYALALGSLPPITVRLRLVRFARIFMFYALHMRRACPTACIVPRWGDDLFLSARLAYLTQAPRRIGFASDVLTPGKPSDPERDLLLTEAYSGGEGVHEPAKFVLLLEEANLIGSTNLAEVSSTPSAALRSVALATDWQELSRRLAIPVGTKFVAIAPGASMARRVWPLACWADVVKFLRVKDLEVILLAGPQDANLARELQVQCAERGLTTTLVAGKTSLVESAALIAHAALFMGSDSGPGHIAGSLGTPSVILFITAPGADPNGPAAPERMRPVGPLVAVCRPDRATPPCEHSCTQEEAHCIKAIRVDAVIGAAESFLQNAQTRASSVKVVAAGEPRNT